jgi:hypothetical protein
LLLFLAGSNHLYIGRCDLVAEDGSASLWCPHAGELGMRRQALEKRSGVTLPQNVFRHSFCSYRISLDQDYAKAAAIVGNSPAMLRKHYVRVLPKKMGQAYFKINPPK